MYFRPYFTTDAVSGVYPASWLTEWNAFFVTGSKFTLTLATNVCDTTVTPKFTGFSSTSGGYCSPTSSLLDDTPHLVVHSGWVGVVVDASMAGGNLLPKLGAVPTAFSSGTSQQIYSALPTSSLVCTLTTASGTVYTLSKSLGFAAVNPVRQGRTMTHLLITTLTWTLGTTSMPAAGSIVAPQWWLEISVWANSITVVLGWDELAVGSGCGVCESATVTMTLTIDGSSNFRTATFTPGLQFNPSGVYFTFENTAAGKSALSLPQAISVTSAQGTVLSRAVTGDVILEVPASWTSCSYSTSCSPLDKMDFTVSNPNTESGLVRLTVSRNFPCRGTIAQSRIGAEITGLSAVLRDANGNPTGVPIQVSKKWDELTVKPLYEARYEVGNAGKKIYSWWTLNLILRLPPASGLSFTLGIIYNRYGGVPSFSHAQLSLIGYTDSWVWQEASLASMGENICFDIIGYHSRAMITDMRVERFTGDWHGMSPTEQYHLFYISLLSRFTILACKQ
jgi:hypothetical protein